MYVGWITWNGLVNYIIVDDLAHEQNFETKKILEMYLVSLHQQRIVDKSIGALPQRVCKTSYHKTLVVITLNPVNPRMTLTSHSKGTFLIGLPGPG